MPSEFMSGFICGWVAVFFVHLIVYAQDQKRKHGRHTPPRYTPPIIDAEFITKPDSQALVRQDTRVRVYRSQEIARRPYGK